MQAEPLIWRKLSELEKDSWEKFCGCFWFKYQPNIEFNLLDFLFNTHIYLERDSYIPYEQGKF